MGSIFTGTYPYKNGLFSLMDIDFNPRFATLAERFRSAGYATHALVSGPMIEATDLNRGFDHYECRKPEQTVFTGWYSDLLFLPISAWWRRELVAWKH